MNSPNDDVEIEAYLRSFRPLPPAPLPAPVRHWRFAVLSAAAALAAGLMVLLLFPQFRNWSPSSPEPQPFTIGIANKLLAGSQSSKSLTDDAAFAFYLRPAKIDPRRRSALEILGQEDPSK